MAKRYYVRRRRYFYGVRWVVFYDHDNVMVSAYSLQNAKIACAALNAEEAKK